MKKLILWLAKVFKVELPVKEVTKEVIKWKVKKEPAIIKDGVVDGDLIVLGDVTIKGNLTCEGEIISYRG